VQAAAQAYLDTPAPDREQMFDRLYARLPAALEKQCDEVMGGSRFDKLSTNG
jgi:hypothetical protein